MIWIFTVFIWVTLGWFVLTKVDKNGTFGDWMNEDPTFGFLSVLLLMVWPVIAFLMYKNRKEEIEQNQKN